MHFRDRNCVYFVKNVIECYFSGSNWSLINTGQGNGLASNRRHATASALTNDDPMYYTPPKTSKRRKQYKTLVMQMTLPNPFLVFGGWGIDPLQWRHNGCDGISNHQPHHCLLNHLFRRRSKKTSKLHVTGLCAENSLVTGEFPHKWPVTRKMFPFDDAIMKYYLWYFLKFHNGPPLILPTRVRLSLQLSSNLARSDQITISYKCYKKRWALSTYISMLWILMDPWLQLDSILI